MVTSYYKCLPPSVFPQENERMNCGLYGVQLSIIVLLFLIGMRYCSIEVFLHEYKSTEACYELYGSGKQ